MTKLTPGTSVILQEKAPLVKVPEVPLQVTEEIPESVSEAVPVAVTPETEKAVPSWGDVIVNTGGVMSMFTVALVEAVFPLESTTVPLMTCLAPSEETVFGPGQLTMEALPAEQVKITVTAVLFQP
jgi:hypothetical protein